MSGNSMKQRLLAKLRRECEQREVIVKLTDCLAWQGVEPGSMLVSPQNTTNGAAMSESDMQVSNADETFGEESVSSPLCPNNTTRSNPFDVQSDSLNPSSSMNTANGVTNKQLISFRRTVGGGSRTVTVKNKRRPLSVKPKRTNSRLTNTIKNHTGQRTSTHSNRNKQNSFYSEIEHEPEEINIEEENYTSKIIDQGENAEHILENFTAQEMLINCVHNYSPYRESSKAIKIKLWSEIHEELKHKWEIKILENKLKYLKENYAKQKLLQKNGFGSSKEWQHTQKIKFRDDIFINKPTTSRVNNVSLEPDLPNVQRPPIEITQNRRSSQDNSWLLLEEQKSTKQESSVSTIDNQFCQYLCCIMEHLPLASKLNLQFKFVNETLKGLNILKSV